MCFELKFENLDVSHYLAQAFWPIASKKLQPYMIDWSDQELKSILARVFFNITSLLG